MTTVISKVLLLVALLGSFENAASIRPQGDRARGLAFQHPSDPHHGIDVSEKVVHEKDNSHNHKENDDGYYVKVVVDDDYYYENKSGKTKSGKAHDRSDYYEYKRGKAHDSSNYYGGKAGKNGNSMKAYDDDYYYYEDKSGKAYDRDDHNEVESREKAYYAYESKNAKSAHHSAEVKSDDYYESKSMKYYSDDYNKHENKNMKYYSNDYNKRESKSMKYYSDDYYKHDSRGKKSEKREKYRYDKNDYEVEYEVEVVLKDEDETDMESEDTMNYDDQDEHYYSDSKSSKVGRRPIIPDFEYIEFGHKAGKKDSKSEKKSKYGYYYGDKDSYGKGYEGKSSKNGKNAKEGKSGGSGGHKLPKAPTISPSPHGGSNDVPLSPTNEPAPTVSPAPVSPSSLSTSPPTEVGSFGIGVPEFSLVYNLLNNDEPKTQELNALEEATEMYLADFFFDEFDEDDFTVFEQFFTDIVDFTYSKNMPVVVDYDSVARFDQLSTITPTPAQLGSAVAEAFTGTEMLKYENWLKEKLPSNNIFVGSEIQYYQGDEGVPDTSRRGIGATGIAASAVAFTLLVAGIVLYKSKSDGRENETDKLNKSPGDMTVAGETFAGETYDGTASVSADTLDYARRYNDEEEGTKGDNLGSIPEKHDARSVKPSWSDDADEHMDEDEDEDFGRGIAAANQTRSAFRGSTISAPRTPGESFQSRAMSSSFEDVGLQAPTYAGGYQDNIMSDPSSSEDDASQMSDSELSQFVASTRQGDNQISGSHTLEIASLLSMDSMDENTSSVSDGLSVRDNSSRRLRTVAEIEALLSSDLKDDNVAPASGRKSKMQAEQQTSRPRTVEEIESLLTADDDDTFMELPFSDEDESIIE